MDFNADDADKHGSGLHCCGGVFQENLPLHAPYGVNNGSKYRTYWGKSLTSPWAIPYFSPMHFQQALPAATFAIVFQPLLGLGLLLRAPRS